MELAGVLDIIEESWPADQASELTCVVVNADTEAAGHACTCKRTFTDDVQTFSGIHQGLLGRYIPSVESK